MTHTSNKIKVHITEDHQLFTEGLRAMLSNEKDIVIDSVSSNQKELMSTIDNIKIDVLLLDIKLPDANGIDILKEIKVKHQNIKVIMISTFSDIATINKCRYVGADAYLLKNSSKELLCQSIRNAIKGIKTFPDLDAESEDQLQFRYYADTYKITKREWEIMQLLKEGKTNQQISNYLFISIYTTETHRKNIMQKLGLKTPSALLLFLINNMI